MIFFWGHEICVTVSVWYIMALPCAGSLKQLRLNCFLCCISLYLLSDQIHFQYFLHGRCQLLVCWQTNRHGHNNCCTEPQFRHRHHCLILLHDTLRQALDSSGDRCVGTLLSFILSRTVILLPKEWWNPASHLCSFMSPAGTAEEVRVQSTLLTCKICFSVTDFHV